jgi:hypothetical protein
MAKRNKSMTATAANPPVSSNCEIDIEARKAEMARIAEQSDAKDVEASVSTLHAAGNPLEAQSADTSSTLNPFDPAALRMDQSFADTVEVKKLLTTVPVRKPSKQEFVRVHPHSAYRLPAGIIEVKEDRETYLVTPKMIAVVNDLYAPVTLFTAINRRGTVFLWPVKLPRSDGRHNEWHRSAAEAAERAMKEWLRISANMSLAAYEMFEAAGDLPEPVWPDFTFQEILKIAFRDRLVDRPDHPLVQSLRGII